jgi:hypothetical protein
LLAVGGQTTGTAIASAESYFSGVPATITNPSTATVVIGATTNIAITTAGTPTPTVSEVGTLPRGLTFSTTTAGNATITGTATGASGTMQITLTATNGVGSPGVQNLTITVSQQAAPGYLVTTNAAVVTAFGQAVNSLQGTTKAPSRRVVTIAKSPGSTGYYVISAAGNVWNKGGAPFFGSTAHTKLGSPISSFATTPNGGGYWLVTQAGTVYAFGNATNYGSISVSAKTRTVIAIDPSTSGNGYYLVTKLGNVFNKGDAVFHGSMARSRLPHPIVAFGVNPTGTGYWLVSSGGNVWNLGGAGWYGSKSRAKLASPVVAFTPTLDGKGYYLIASNGTVYNYKDAIRYGSPAVAAKTRVTGITIPD